MIRSSATATRIAARTRLSSVENVTSAFVGAEIRCRPQGPAYERFPNEHKVDPPRKGEEQLSTQTDNACDFFTYQGAIDGQETKGDSVVGAAGSRAARRSRGRRVCGREHGAGDKGR